MPERAPRTGAAAAPGPSGAAARPATRTTASSTSSSTSSSKGKAKAAAAAETPPAQTTPDHAAPDHTAPDQTTATRAAGHEKAPARSAARKATAGAAAPLVAVRAGESRWTAQELEGIRAELGTEVHRIEVEVESLQTAIADVLRDSGDGAGDDQADTGSKAFEREQEMTLLANTRETLFQTERALARIEDGTYGSCESCGEAIGKARLQAFPRATLCVACKQRQERR